jgi:hypothetical protein
LFDLFAPNTFPRAQKFVNYRNFVTEPVDVATKLWIFIQGGHAGLLPSLGDYGFLPNSLHIVIHLSVRVRVTLRQVVYGQSFLLGDKPL